MKLKLEVPFGCRNLKTNVVKDTFAIFCELSFTVPFDHHCPHADYCHKFCTMTATSCCHAIARCRSAQLGGWLSTGGQLPPCHCISLWSLIFPASVCCWTVIEFYRYLIADTTTSSALHWAFMHGHWLITLDLYYNFVYNALCRFAMNLNGMQRYRRAYHFWDMFTKGAYNGHCCSTCPWHCCAKLSTDMSF